MPVQLGSSPPLSEKRALFEELTKQKAKGKAQWWREWVFKHQEAEAATDTTEAVEEDVFFCHIPCGASYEVRTSRNWSH